VNKNRLKYVVFTRIINGFGALERHYWSTLTQRWLTWRVISE